MHKNLLVPMAGKSSRFPGVRPKWMLTHPTGRFMVIKALDGLDLGYFDFIYFIFLKEHEEEYHFLKGFKSELEAEGLLAKSRFVFLENETQNQPETVYEAIVKNDINGQIFIKDSDNYFKTSVFEGNAVYVNDLNSCGLVNPSNKSYILKNEDNLVTNIIEKKVISPFFCVGGYSFESHSLFIEKYLKLSGEKNLFISNIIFDCLLDNIQFQSKTVTDYRDWGTLKDWNDYKKTYATIFIDLDGTLVYNSASHFPPYYGDTSGIFENIQILKDLKSKGKIQIIITTSRAEQYREVTIKQLFDLGIEYDHLIMGLFHSKRIIINDYANSNPFKSCDSINLKRDSKELNEILKDSMGFN